MGPGEGSDAIGYLAQTGEGEEEEEEEGTSAEMMETMRRKRKKKKRQQESVCRSIVRILLPMPCLGMAGVGGGGVLRDGSGGSRVTGTLFGQRQGNVQFAMQGEPRSEPVLLLELPILTSDLVRDMASTCVRIVLEAERKAGPGRPLYEEPIWSVFCDGHQIPGFAMPRRPSPTHSHMLSLIQAVSMGAGVLPPPLSSPKPTEDSSNNNEEVMYMRANFERVVASRDSEAFYMMNPDGSGSPELTIFLFRV